MSYEVAVGEMHILAYCYHWGLNEIKDLSIRERAMWCEMVRKQKKAEEQACKSSSGNDAGNHSSYHESF